MRPHGRACADLARKREVDRAQRLSSELSFSRRVQSQVVALSALGDPSEVRARAMTLLMRAYDDCRRAITYVRWSEGDADVIAPAIKRKVARVKREGSTGETPTPPSVE
jgi:hypothetical protein